MKYIVNNEFYNALLDEEICLFDPKKGEYHNLNKVGTYIWQNLNKGLDIDGIVNILMKKYEVSEKQCYQETEKFLSKAVNEKIILTLSNS